MPLADRSGNRLVGTGVSSPQRTHRHLHISLGSSAPREYVSAISPCGQGAPVVVLVGPVFSRMFLNV